MVTQDLGYCCEFAFFALFKKTLQVAERLGVSRQAVQKKRRAFREGLMKCENCEKCLKKSGNFPQWRWRRLPSRRDRSGAGFLEEPGCVVRGDDAVDD